MKHADIAIAVCVAMSLVVVAVYWMYKTDHAQRHMSPSSPKYVAGFNDPVMGHTGGSVDSERQFGKDQQWRGQHSSCFDCEDDMAQRCGDASVYNATKQKLFSTN